jgi:hypothetical protein
MVFYNSSFSSFGNSYGIDGIRILPADRQPCPVCGHPTGDCATTEKDTPVRIIGFETDLEGKEVPLHYVEEEVWEEKQITPYTKARVLLYKRGDKITLSEAKRLGLL